MGKPEPDLPVHRPSKSRRGLRLLLLGISAAWLAGCATPVGVTRVDLREASRDLNVTALTARSPSYDTEVVLHRYDLRDRFDKDPEAVLVLLRDKAVGEDDRRDLRFALAELDFLYADRLWESIDPAERRLAPDYFLVAAAMAYHYLLGESREPPPGAYDRRFRVACDLYNQALGRGLATGPGGRLELQGGVRHLPLGPVTIRLDTRGLPWPVESVEEFLPADDVSVRGLTVRNRTPGLGLPLIAVLRKTPEAPRGQAVPVTAFLGVSREAAGGAHAVSARLELYSAFEESELDVGGRRIPLETDTTAPLAYLLGDPFVWKQGVRRFLHLEGRVEPGVKSLEPYRPGRIPVVFVHGTASSAVWWAEMFNTLGADPVLRKRCQLWFFQYNSSAPVVDSARLLRESLSRMVGQVDPEGKDPALGQMVVIGHSQGGLLTKMTVVRTGDRLWRAFSDEDFEAAMMDPATKQLVRQDLFIEPLPFVTRVVFLSTPHRGSFRASGWVRNLVRWLVSLPADLVEQTSAFLKVGDRLRLPASVRGKIPTSVDGMSPENPLLGALVATPVEPGVKAHSIIPVLGEGDYRTGNDGVVEYKSAHLDGVESEFIVRTGHSCQSHPLAIEEVRRILLEHVGAPSTAPLR